MQQNQINKLDFLMGEWELEYNITMSSFSEAKTDSGTGSLKKILNDQYLQFEYSTQSGAEGRLECGLGFLKLTVEWMI